MSVYHKIEGKVARIYVADHFSIDELLSGFRKTLDDPNITTGTHILIDVTKSEVLPPFEVIEQIAAILCESRDRFSCQLAILVSQMVRYGRAMQLSAFLDNKGIKARPFYKYREAIDWLNVNVT